MQNAERHIVVKMFTYIFSVYNSNKRKQVHFLKLSKRSFLMSALIIKEKNKSGLNKSLHFNMVGASLIVLYMTYFLKFNLHSYKIKPNRKKRRTNKTKQKKRQTNKQASKIIGEM